VEGVHPCRLEKRSLENMVGEKSGALQPEGAFSAGLEARLYGRQGCLTATSNRTLRKRPA